MIDLCRRLDGLPLALELAASWTPVLPPETLLTHLEDGMSLPDPGLGDLPDHQRTLRTTLQWSHDLLGPDERVLFRRLAVFRGGFDLAAVAAVCADGRPTAADVLLLLSALVDKSLVVVEARPGRPPSYRLLDTIRWYAAEMLAAGEGQEAVHDRHAAHFLQLAEAARHAAGDASHAEWARRLEEVHPDTRAALTWYRSRDASAWARFVTALGWFWMTRGHLKEAVELLHAVLAIVPSDSAERADALYAMARLADCRADFTSAVRLVSDCLALAEERCDVTRAGWARYLLGCIRIYTREHDAARIAFDRVLSNDIDSDLRAATLIGLGDLLLEGGETEKARDVLLSALAVALQSNASVHIGRANLFLAFAEYLCADLAPAREHLAESLRRFAEIGHWNGWPPPWSASPGSPWSMGTPCVPSSSAAPRPCSANDRPHRCRTPGSSGARRSSSSPPGPRRASKLRRPGRTAPACQSRKRSPTR